jgi:hypothetical protein
MNKREGGEDLSDLGKEIDSVVDTLLVEEKTRSNTVPQPKKNLSPVQEATITAKPSFTPPSALASASQRQQMKPISRELQEKLEEVEAQLLTLEWDISSKHINNAITHLQDLRRLSHVDDELEKVIILIQKVLHQLILDESKLTPSALKFLQKSWKAVKGMTDERFSFEIDKKTLVQELMTEFQKLRIEEAPRERAETIEAPRPPGGRISLLEERIIQKPPVEAKIPFAELDKFMNKIENLERIVNEERKRWESIHQEISAFKVDMQKSLSSGGKLQRESHEEEIVELDENIEREPHRPSDLELQQDLNRPTLAVSLVNVSGIIFGIPEKQIIRSFPIKRWVSEFFIERGKVKLKNREIPLFNILQVFKLKPSTEENPHVLLLRGREDHLAAIIIDQGISREEIEYQLIKGRPYILGQGISKSGRVWILDAEQISP